MYRCILILFILNCNVLHASDSLLIPKLFQNLLNKQILESNFFKEGSFTSYRQHANKDELVADNNIFYTALIAYTLQDLKPYLTKDELIVSDTIINRTKKAFELYKNKKGRWSYNFWPTDNRKVFFPNDKLLSKFSEQLSLPDDLDDSGIILSVLGLNDSVAQVAHHQMQEFYNGNYSTINNTYSEYKDSKSYSTWYGVKMPIDFDFGVHCNILSFVNRYNLPWSSVDSATYNLILHMIDKKLYLESPQFISPYYGSSPVLLYHISRLMSSKKLPDLENRKTIFINESKTLIEKTSNQLEKILLQNSILKWGVDEKTLELPSESVNGIYNTTDFVYYTGHLFGHLNKTIRSLANKLSITQFKWYSASFNDCLLLENLILKYRKKN